MKKMNKMTMGLHVALLAMGVMASTNAAPARSAAAKKAPVATRLATAAPTAPRPGCIQLRSTAETEKQTVDEQGAKVVRLVPAAAVVPGTQVVWTVTASNVCDTAVGNVLIENPIPEHTSYVADSALGAGAAITFSLDGKRYATPDALTVRDANEQERSARADEYSHIRWVFQNPIAPSQVAIARFRALVK
jgi:uncharacterized repeat protein (TIGR01451 family)